MRIARGVWRDAPRKFRILGAVCWQLSLFCGHDCKLNNPVLMRFLREKILNLWSSIWKKYKFSSRHFARGVEACPLRKFRILGAVWCHLRTFCGSGCKHNNHVFYMKF